MQEPGTHKLTEALAGQPAPSATGPPEGGPPVPTPAEVAEEARRHQEAGPDVVEDRQDKLIRIGRGQQTHG